VIALIMSPIVAELVVKIDPSQQLCATFTLKMESKEFVYISNLIIGYQYSIVDVAVLFYSL